MSHDGLIHPAFDDAARITELEWQNRQLREALEEIRRIASGENDFYEDDSAGIVAIDKIAIAALAATEKK